MTPPISTSDRWTSWASPRGGEFARGVLVALMLLAASPFHAPCSTFSLGHHGHAHTQVAQTPAPHVTLTDLTSVDHSSFVLEPTVAPFIGNQNDGGLHRPRPILRL